MKPLTTEDLAGGPLGPGRMAQTPEKSHLNIKQLREVLEESDEALRTWKKIIFMIFCEGVHMKLRMSEQVFWKTTDNWFLDYFNN